MGSGPSIKVGVRRGRRSPGHKRAGGFLLIEMPPLRSQPGEGSEQEEEPGATVGLSTAEVTSSEVAITSLAHMFESLMRGKKERRHIRNNNTKSSSIRSTRYSQTLNTRAGITTTE